MIHKFDSDFIKIAGQINIENKTVEEWAEIESGDMFQSGNYCGGFEALENEFCFSVYIEETEYWFQVSLDQILKIKNGDITEIEIRLPDR